MESLLQVGVESKRAVLSAGAAAGIASSTVYRYLNNAREQAQGVAARDAVQLSQLQHTAKQYVLGDPTLDANCREYLRWAVQPKGQENLTVQQFADFVNKLLAPAPRETRGGRRCW